jgi:hypothetical protein
MKQSETKRAQRVDTLFLFFGVRVLAGYIRQQYFFVVQRSRYDCAYERRDF